MLYMKKSGCCYSNAMCNACTENIQTGFTTYLLHVLKCAVCTAIVIYSRISDTGCQCTNDLCYMFSIFHLSYLAVTPLVNQISNAIE